MSYYSCSHCGHVAASLVTQYACFNQFAEDTESGLKVAIKGLKDNFVGQRPRAVEWAEEVFGWCVDTLNSCPLFEALGEFLTEALDKVKGLLEFLQEFYMLGGGRELLDIIGAIGGAILNIVGLVIDIVVAILMIFASPFTGGASIAVAIIAILAAIGSLLSTLDSVVNIWQSFEGLKAWENGDPAWARIYGDTDSVAAYLYRHNFDNGVINILSYLGAGGMVVGEGICDIASLVMMIINPVDGVKEGTKGLKLVTKGGKVLNIGKGVFGSIGLVGDVIGDMCDKNFDIRDYIEHGTDALGGIFGSIGDFTSDDFMGLIGGAIDWKGDHFWTSEDTKDVIDFIRDFI